MATLVPLRFPKAADLDERWTGNLRSGGPGFAAAINATKTEAASYDTLPHLAAYLVDQIVNTAPLASANRRAAIVVADDFMRLNGYQIGGWENDELDQDTLIYNTVVGLADDSLTVAQGESTFGTLLNRSTARPFEERFPTVLADLGTL